MDAQLKELLTGYGEIGGIWFDGWWDKPEADWRLDSTYKLIHDLQPAALVGANHHRRPFPGEDFQMFEKDLPGHNTAGFNKDAEIGELPLETCETMNNSWGFNLTDRRYKSTRELIHYLVRAAGYNANFLLNVGPMPNGKIQPEFVTRLGEMGQWLSRYGEAIYGTRGGPVSPRSWGVTTRKDNRVYVHILNWPASDMLWVPVSGRVKAARYLRDGSAAGYVEVEGGVLLKSIPQRAVDEYDTIVALELEGK
jgi:alpha-L-fucosidase